MKAADVMTRIAIAVRPEDSVLSALQLMLDNKVSGLPVINNAGELAGIVTESDFLRRAELGTAKHRPWWQEQFMGVGHLASEYVHTHARRIDDVMTRSVHTVSEETPLEHVVHAMEQFKIKRIPVMNGGTLVGIISRTDLLRTALTLMTESLKAASGNRHPTDDEIRAQLMTEMEQQAWTAKGCVDPQISNGVVDLCGTIFDERERAALRVLVENIPGVETVCDHLIYIEPISGVAVPPPQVDVQPIGGRAL